MSFPSASWAPTCAPALMQEYATGEPSRFLRSEWESAHSCGRDYEGNQTKKQKLNIQGQQQKLIGVIRLLAIKILPGISGVAYRQYWSIVYTRLLLAVPFTTYYNHLSRLLQSPFLIAAILFPDCYSSLSGLLYFPFRITTIPFPDCYGSLSDNAALQVLDHFEKYSSIVTLIIESKI